MRTCSPSRDTLVPSPFGASWLRRQGSCHLVRVRRYWPEEVEWGWEECSWQKEQHVWRPSSERELGTAGPFSWNEG